MSVWAMKEEFFFLKFFINFYIYNINQPINQLITGSRTRSINGSDVSQWAETTSGQSVGVGHEEGLLGLLEQ